MIMLDVGAFMGLMTAGTLALNYGAGYTDEAFGVLEKIHGNFLWLHKSQPHPAWLISAVSLVVINFGHVVKNLWKMR